MKIVEKKILTIKNKIFLFDSFKKDIFGDYQHKGPYVKHLCFL